ncbi:MAG: hypothetical protein PHR52_10970 [Fermentimonas sp.]|nr:hypothetical protein [Fermentimonas sp.]
MAIIQKPDALSMSGNMKKFIVSSGSQIVFELKEGNSTLLSATYESGVDGRATIDVKDIIENRLSYTLSHTNFYEQTEIVKTFTAIIDGSSFTFKVIRCGVANLADTVSNWLRDNFLTWQPTNKQITYYSPEWITYYAQEACTVKLKATFPDAEQTLITLGSCDSGKAFTFNLQYAVISGLLGQKYPTHYDVWVENLTGTRLTYIQRYLYTEQKSDLEQWFLFENSLGGLDTIRTSGDTDFAGEYDHKLSSTDNITKEYLVDAKRVYNQNTGYLDDYERRWLLDFFPAIQKYIYHISAIRKIVVTDSDVKYSAAALPSSYNFSYHFIEENEAALLNLIRNQEAIPASITIPNLDSPDFHLPPRLSEYPRLPLHEGVILPAFDPYNEDPTVTTFGAILEAAIIEVLNRIEAGEGGGELVSILRSADPEAPSDYNVFSSLRTLLEIRKYFNENLGDIDKKYLRKDIEDIAREKITFLKGIIAADLSEFTDMIASGKITAHNIDVENHLLTNTLKVILQADIQSILLRGQMNSETFSSGMFGHGMRLRKDGEDWELELDKIIVRKAMTVYELIVQEMRYQGGQHIFGPAGAKLTNVTNGGSYWKCEHDGTMDFITGSQVFCQRFDVGSKAENSTGSQSFNGARVKRYWRLVTSYGPGWFNLSKSDCEPGSDIPEVNDQVAVLGHRINPDWQNATVLVSTGPNAPYLAHYARINSYSLVNKEPVRQGNLEGIVDAQFGQLHGHGLYAENVFLKGQFRLNNSKLVEDAIDEANRQQTVGAFNLLREYDARFDFKYWGQDGEKVEIDFSSIDRRRVLIAADRDDVLLNEDNNAFKIIL